MSKIATYKASVAQATEQQIQHWEAQTSALQETTAHIDQLRESLSRMPEQIAKRILPAAQALDVIVRTTNDTLTKLRGALTATQEAKDQTHQAIASVEFHAHRLQETAETLLQQQRDQNRKDLWKVALMSAAMAAALSLAVTLSSLYFWPSQQAEIGQRVLDVLPKTNDQTRDWLNSNFVHPRS